MEYNTNLVFSSPEDEEDLFEYESFYAMLQTAGANEGLKGKVLKVTNKNKIVKLLVGKDSIESLLFNKYFKVEIEKLKELVNNGTAPFDIVFDPSVPNNSTTRGLDRR